MITELWPAWPVASAVGPPDRRARQAGGCRYCTGTSRLGFRQSITRPLVLGTLTSTLTYSVRRRYRPSDLLCLFGPTCLDHRFFRRGASPPHHDLGLSNRLASTCCLLRGQAFPIVAFPGRFVGIDGSDDFFAKVDTGEFSTWGFFYQVTTTNRRAFSRIIPL